MLNQLIFPFITGLTNGGISCSAVQGGLLTIAVSDKRSKLLSTSLFMASKIITHTILGAILGAFGSLFVFSLQLQGGLQILVGLFMIATALKIAGVKYLNIINVNLPTSFKDTISKITNKYPKIKPLILGASTIFIPCGTTQAMFILAVGSGSALNGALIMLAFVLGTTPIFFAIGLTVGQMFKFNILKNVATAILIVIGMSSINNGQVLRGSKHTLQNYYFVLTGVNATNSASIVGGYQQINVKATNTGYELSNNVVKKDIPVKLVIESENLFSCASNFVIPSLNINQKLPSNGVKVIEFTPNQAGPLTFSCGMGMFTGNIIVEE